MDNIRYDFARYFQGEYNLLNVLRLLKVPGFCFMFFFRKASTSKNILFKFFYGRILNHLSYKFGFQIPVGTNIGPGFYIGHFGTIVINSQTCIGNNCNIAHGVTIGQSNRGNNKGVPHLGNNVWIGTNAVIVGRINIGNDVLIAPNTFVNIDVPDHSIVVGSKAKIIRRENATEGYINNYL